MVPNSPSVPATVFAWAGSRFGAGPSALFALDAQWGAIVRTTTEPMVGQMRLTWWHDALIALDSAPPPAHPLLVDLAGHVVPVTGGTALAAMIEAWEILIDPTPPDAPALARFGAVRGGTLFGALAQLGGAGGEEMTLARSAGSAWALADLAAHVSDSRLARSAREGAVAALSDVREAAWPRRLRPLAALTRDTRLAVTGRGAPASARRAAGVLALLIGR